MKLIEILYFRTEFPIKLKEFCKKYIKKNLSTKIYNTVPELIKKIKAHKIEKEKNNQIMEELNEEEFDEIDYDSNNFDQRQNYIENLKRKQKKFSEWEFPNPLGSKFSYNDGILELLNVFFFISKT